MGNSSSMGKIAMILDNPNDQKKLRAAFEQYDEDGNNTLDRNEFSSFIKDLEDNMMKDTSMHSTVSLPT